MSTIYLNKSRSIQTIADIAACVPTDYSVSFFIHGGTIAIDFEYPLDYGVPEFWRALQDYYADKSGNPAVDILEIVETCSDDIML